jgi:hypothetical protein
LTARNEQAVVSHVVFMDAPDAGVRWFQTDLRRQAEAIPGVHVFCDRDGIESERFGARTSGLALLYSDTGYLLFQGGITASRGHEGQNDGIVALEAMIHDKESSLGQTPVFGCPLQMPAVLALKD